MVTTSKQSGFTLIELLLSLSIFATLVGLSTYSIMHFQQFWHSNFGQFEHSRVNTQLLNQLNDVYLSAYPQTVLTRSGGEAYYFLGDENGNTFVTASPVFSGSSVNAVVRIFKERSDSGYRLVYEEAPLDKEPLIYLDQELNFTYRVVLNNDISEITFLYCGYNERYAELGEVSRAKPSCYKIFDGVETNLNPSVVRIQYDNSILAFSLSNAENLLESSGFDL